MSAVTPGELRARNLRTLGALAALFLAPLVLAFFTYYGTDWRPSAHVNHGHLITPARPLPQAALERIDLGAGAPAAARGAGGPSALPPVFRTHWSLVYVGISVLVVYALIAHFEPARTTEPQQDIPTA